MRRTAAAAVATMTLVAAGGADAGPLAEGPLGPHLRRVAEDRTGGAMAAEAETPPAGALAGTRWRLVALGAGPAEAEGQREPPSLIFDPEGAAYGTGGCNRIRSRWTAGADRALSLGLAASTMMACPEPAMRLEREFLGMLERVDAYRIEGGRLTLLGAGRVLAAFEPAPDE